MEARGAVQVVGLNGSPHRNGNTATLINWVLEGCEEAGAQADWIHVADYNIQPCDGCLNCLRMGDCVLRDDLRLVRKRLLDAAGLVVGSPVYGGQPTAQLKTVMDRLMLLNLYTSTFGQQRAVGVATGAFSSGKGLAKELASFFGQPCGALGAKTSSAVDGHRALSAGADSNLAKKARRTGERLVSRAASPLRVPRLDLLGKRLRRKMALQRMAQANPDQFAGALAIWESRGGR
jgi:multimeric flavodoxin WrbA